MKHKLKHLQSLVAVAVCVIMGLAFASCSDDDDEPDGNSIVGTWLASHEGSSGDYYWYIQFNFKKNGTFESKDWYSDEEPEPKNYQYKGTWSVSEDSLTMTYEDGEVDTYRVSLNGKELTIYNYEGREPYVFVRR